MIVLTALASPLLTVFKDVITYRCSVRLLSLGGEGKSDEIQK